MSCKIRINGEMHFFDHSPSVTEVLEHLGLTARKVAIDMNGEIVVRSRYGDIFVSDGTSLEIVTAIGGG